MTLSLTTRLLVFFLATLALVLTGFSVTLYLLADSYLSRQVDERLQSSLNTLDAAIEREPDGLEWEPQSRHITLGQDKADDQPRWLLRDNQGRRLAVSANLNDGSLADTLLATQADDAHHWEMGKWRLARRRLEHSPASSKPYPPDRYATLTLTVAASLEPMRALLRNLVFVLTVLSLTVWVLAAVLSRLLCRRALLPVTRMATTARGITATGLDQRLPILQTGDELADLSSAFNDLLARLQDAFERQRRFTGDASHQLRTPLTAMLGQVEVALRRPRSTEEYQRVLGLVHEQAGRLRQITEMLLFLARADAESKRPQLNPIELAAWLRHHARSWSEHPRAGDLKLESASDAQMWVHAQEALLGQLLDNVWDNACKYSEPGRPITLRAWEEPEQVCLTVEDCGCGIAADELPVIFEAFYRSPRSRQAGVGGVGLGLAVVQRIAAVFGGEISIQSEVGHGSTFLLRLPKPCNASASLL